MLNFFVKETVKEPLEVRDTALVYWDIQNLAPSLVNVSEWDTFIKSEVHRRVPQVDRKLLKAFSNQLEEKGWRVWEDIGTKKSTTKR